MRNYLFGGTSIYDVVEAQKTAARKTVADLEPNYLLNSSEEDLVAALVEELRLEVPVLGEPYIADYGETPVDVSQDPMRLVYDRSRPAYVTGTTVRVAVPFTGAEDFFEVQPSTYSLNPPAGEAADGELRLDFTRLDHSNEALKRDYEAWVSQVRTNLDTLRGSAERFNAELLPLLTGIVQVRKRKLLADAGLAASLGLPIKRRGDAPTTYAAPVQRRRPHIERPPSTEAAFVPEPALKAEEYEQILSIIRSMVLVMERSPHAFQGMKEEDLRTHFLVQLNGQYEGQASGETFNFQGKTDILIRADNRNVFIAECKFWAGEKSLLETIDQLLSYVSWRDTKTAIVLFNRNRNFSDVLDKIAAAVPTHPCFKRDLGRTNETAFRYVFHQPGDPNREIMLTVLAFDVPTA
jgi:hypothetical protein